MIFIVPFFLLVARIGEASHPGPWCDLDESQASVLEPDHFDIGAGLALVEQYSNPCPGRASLGHVGCLATPSLSSAKAFAGARAGVVFKLGESGLGYYRDDEATRGTGVSCVAVPRDLAASSPPVSLLSTAQGQGASRRDAFSCSPLLKGLVAASYPCVSLPAVPVQDVPRKRRARRNHGGYVDVVQMNATY